MTTCSYHVAIWAVVLPTLGLGFMASEVNSKPKNTGVNQTCECLCLGDNQGDQAPRLRSTIEFKLDIMGSCASSNNGGCRIKKPNGTYVAGTMRRCGKKYALDTPAADVRETGGADSGPRRPYRPPVEAGPATGRAVAQ